MKLEQCYVGQTVGITINGDKYIGEVVEIKVDNANGKHSAVFKNDNGVNEVLISKLLGVLKWLTYVKWIWKNKSNGYYSETVTFVKVAT